jgi:hypothetical protein
VVRPDYTKRIITIAHKREIYHMTEYKTTYEYACFGVFMNAFADEDVNVIKRRIKSRLRYYKLGKFDQDRVNTVKKVHDELLEEFSRATASQYYIKTTGKYADPGDFDLDRMVRDYRRKYSAISKGDLIGMMNYSIFYYYLK